MAGAADSGGPFGLTRPTVRLSANRPCSIIGRIDPGAVSVPFRSGENVGPYRIIEQLGQGGMATVFKAYHPALDRHVAIKAMHPAFMQDPQFLARFEREARVVASLDHPNIVPIYDFAQQSGQPYLVMKFVESAIWTRAPTSTRWGSCSINSPSAGCPSMLTRPSPSSTITSTPRSPCRARPTPRCPRQDRKSTRLNS